LTTIFFFKRGWLQDFHFFIAVKQLKNKILLLQTLISKGFVVLLYIITEYCKNTVKSRVQIPTNSCNCRRFRA